MARILIGSQLLDLVCQIGSLLNSNKTEKEILSNIMYFVKEVFMPENWSILSYCKYGNILEFKVVADKKLDSLIGKIFSANTGVAGLCLKQHSPIVIPDAEKNNEILALETQEVKIKTIIAVPIYSNSKPLGVFELINVNDACFSSKKIKLLETVADFMAIAMQKSMNMKIIEEKVSLDDCTDLYNAKFMQIILEKELSHFKRSGTPFGITCFDLDYFNHIVATHPDCTGLKLLCEVAKTIKKSIRPTDWAIRVERNKFIVVFQNAGYNETLLVTERIRNNLNTEIFFKEEGYNIKVTASFGTAVFPEDGGTIKEILQAADSAMYQAKRSGRNRICQRL